MLYRLIPVCRSGNRSQTCKAQRKLYQSILDRFVRGVDQPYTALNRGCTRDAFAGAKHSNTTTSGKRVGRGFQRDENPPTNRNHSTTLALYLFFCVFVYTFVHSNFNQKREKERNKKEKTRVGNVFHLPNNSSTLLLRKRNCRNGEMVRLLMN